MIRLDDALGNITTLGFDTAPFIYFIERHPTYIDRVRAIFQRVDSGVVIGYSSMITLTETLTQPKQTGNRHLEQAYRSVLLHSRNFTLLPITAVIAERAADLRARYRIRTPDALQLAGALDVGCQAFVTNDGGLKRVTDLRVIVLDEVVV